MGFCLADPKSRRKSRSKNEASGVAVLGVIHSSHNHTMHCTKGEQPMKYTLAVLLLTAIVCVGLARLGLGLVRGFHGFFKWKDGILADR